MRKKSNASAISRSARTAPEFNLDDTRVAPKNDTSHAIIAINEVERGGAPEKPFAGPNNVRHTTDRWTHSISRGEMLREGYDERLEIDPANLRFLFQGFTNKRCSGKPYGQIPWRLGLMVPDHAPDK